MRAPSIAFLVLVLAACGDDNSADSTDTTDTTTDDPSDDTDDDTDANPPDADDGMDVDSSSACPRLPAPADRKRYMVVAQPYETVPGTFTVVEVSETGVLTRINKNFVLSRTPFGTIEFTPDGELGFVATDMGQLAEFRLAADGTPEVLTAALPNPSFYAKRVVMDPSGDHLYVVDANTPENGGGIYRVDIGCDGELTDRGLVATARTPGGLVVLDGGKAVVSANSVLGTPVGDTVHLLDLASTPATVVDGVNAFTRPDLFVGGFAASYTQGIYMVGDVNAFDGQPNGVAVMRVASASVTLLNVVTGIEDPQGIAFAPAGGLALVTSALEDDAIFLVDDNGPSNAWRVRGEVSYTGGNPQLPGDLTAIKRGSLDGHVFVSEVTGIRHLRFEGDTVVDLGVFSFGDESLGALGIQP
jgi:hypothetical protein